MSVFRDIERYLLKILQPEKEEINGTGFFCHPDGYILTCYHVIEPHLNAGKTDVHVIYQGERHRAKICNEYCIEGADIAVLKLFEPLPSLKYLPLDVYDLWGIKDEIYGFGYPLGYFKESGIGINGSVGGPTRHEGIGVVQIIGLNISNVSPGYSGAPVLNVKNEKVIGLIYARYEPTQAFFVPLAKLLQRWQELKEFHDVFKKIRSKLAQKAKEELDKKLRGSRFIPLNLECGTIPEKPEEEERERTSEWAHGREWQDFDLKTLPSFSKSYILSSSVGTGKTTFLYWLVTELVSKDVVPIFMTCAEFERINPGGWNDLRKQLTLSFNHDFLEEDIENFFDTYFRREELFFLFDGLDQIKGDDYLNLAKTIFNITSRNHVIISSRPSSVISFESERDISFLRLKPFSAEDEKQYFADDYEKARSVSRVAPDLTRIPMLASMVKILIREGKATNIFTRADIYSRFLDHIIYHHDPNIPLSSQKVQQTEDIKKALKRISFDALNLKKPQIQKISISIYSQKDFRIPVDDLPRFGLVNLVLETADSTQHSLFFSHQSFQEFLAAQYIDEDKERIERVIDEMWSPRWKEVIRFLAGIRGQEIVDMIYSQKDNIIHSQLFLAAECLAEVRDVSGEIKEEINSKIRDLIKIEPFRIDVISALRSLGDIIGLKLLLSDEDGDVRRAALMALTKLKDRVNDEVIREIAGRLRDEELYVRGAAVWALTEFRDRVNDEVIREIVGWLRVEGLYVSEEGVRALTEFRDRINDEMVKEIAGWLKDEDSIVREGAARALAELKDRISNEAIKEIACQLRDDKWYVREAALMALTKLKDRVNDEVIREIAGRLKDEELYVRGVAVRALTEFKDRVTDETVKEIVGLLRVEGLCESEGAVIVLVSRQFSSVG